MQTKTIHYIRHLIDFSLLATIIGLGLGGVIYFRFDFVSQIAIVLLMAGLYVIWGIYHHYHEANLTGKVVLEYIAIALLVAFILITYLGRL